MYVKFYCFVIFVGSVVIILLEVEDVSYDWVIEKKLVCFECCYESFVLIWFLYWLI